MAWRRGAPGAPLGAASGTPPVSCAGVAAAIDVVALGVSNACREEGALVEEEAGVGVGAATAELALAGVAVVVLGADVPAFGARVDLAMARGRAEVLATAALATVERVERGVAVAC